MAHFAKLNDNNEVVQVVVVNNDVITVDGNESEQAGIDFLTETFGYSNWKQTSFNATFRKNYAGTGMIYDATRDAFMSRQPYPSWTLNETTCQWEAQVSRPTDEKDYVWSESEDTWVERTFPVENHHL